jgi:hypothetical protein
MGAGGGVGVGFGVGLGVGLGDGVAVGLLVGCTATVALRETVPALNDVSKIPGVRISTTTTHRIRTMIATGLDSARYPFFLSDAGYGAVGLSSISMNVLIFHKNGFSIFPLRTENPFININL